MNRVMVLTCAALLAAYGWAGAQTLADVTSAEQALTAVNDKTPVTAGVSALVKTKATAFGMYEVRATNAYHTGDDVLFYVEPVGLKHVAKDGLITCGLAMDLLVKRDGTIVYGKERFIDADFPSHHALQEIMLNGDLTMNAPAGPYELELVLHDHNSTEVGRHDAALRHRGRRRPNGQVTTPPANRAHHTNTGCSASRGT